MPSYDYRCNQCKSAFILHYATYKAYDEATHTCPNCQSTDLTRLISQVGISRTGRSYSNLSSNEMLSVLEGGNAQEVGQLFRQVGESVPGGDTQYHEVADRLLGGESMDAVESSLREKSDKQITQDKKKNTTAPKSD